MRGFGAVVEAEGVFAGFTAEGEEVELVAVGVLAVGAYSVEVFVHSGEGLRVRGRGGCWMRKPSRRCSYRALYMPTGALS